MNCTVSGDEDVRAAIIELYLNVKIRSTEDVSG